MYRLILLLLLAPTFTFAQDDYDKVVFLYSEHEFKESSIQYLYGDKVVFRKKASSEAQSIDTLAIGSEITILKKSKETLNYNGIEWNWYKVKYNGKTGFILGGLLSLTSEEINGDRYLVTASKEKKEDEEFETTILHYRILTSTGKFRTGKAQLYTDAFSIQVSDNKGLEGVSSILFIEYFVEACGVDGGGIYIFYDGNNLKEALRVARVTDGGAFWFYEELTFPTDENGQEGIIIYEREQGEEVNEEFAWTKAVRNSLFLKWENGKITPNPKDLEFGEN